MGKLRLNCPNCGKAVAVSETAKKARCPGCKKVMDVAAALAGDLDPSTELSAEQQTGAAGAAPPPAAEGEAAAPKRPSSRATRKSGRKSSRREEAAPKGEAPEREIPPVPTFDLPAGAQPWMVIVGVAVVAAPVLWLVANVNPIAAIGIVSALGLFVDSALMRVTRVSPSGGGWSLMPMVWGLIGFAPVVGVVVYVLLRRKLVENSPQDIATPDMDEDDMSFEGKVRPPSVVSVGIVLVLALAVGGGMFFQLLPSTWVEVGTTYSEQRNLLDGQHERHFYNIGKLIGRFHAKNPLVDYEALSFDVVKINADGTSASVDADGVEVNINSDPRAAWFSFEVKESGRHRLLVKGESGSVYATYDFRVLRKSSR
ncbi:MAG: hypothetical protein ACYTKD_16475 [Planctomycetota bacterium]|jgi:hypothetical protein